MPSYLVFALVLSVLGWLLPEQDHHLLSFRVAAHPTAPIYYNSRGAIPDAFKFNSIPLLASNQAPPFKRAYPSARAAAPDGQEYIWRRDFDPHPPPSPLVIERRQFLEGVDSVEQGMNATAGNLTTGLTDLNAALVPVSISEDGQCVRFFFAPPLPPYFPLVLSFAFFVFG